MGAHTVAILKWKKKVFDKNSNFENLRKIEALIIDITVQ